MKWFIPILLVSLFIFSITLGTVSAWYETDESALEKNYAYMNTDWVDNQDFVKYKMGDFFTNSDLYIQNLEPGHFIAYNAELPALIKYDSLGTLEWMEISDLGENHAYEKPIVIDNDYDIYISTQSGVLKIDGQDGDLLWMFDDMTGVTAVIELEISTDSDELLAYATNGYTVILDTNDGSIINGPVDIDNVNEWKWLYDEKLIAVKTAGWDLYHSDLTEHYAGPSSNDYTNVYVNHFQKLNGFTTNNTDFLFLVKGGQLQCLAYYNETVNPLWDYDDSTYGNIVTNVVHNEFANHVYYGMADGSPASAVPLRLVCINFDETNDWLNDSIVWTSGAYTGDHATSARIICDNEGDVIFSRIGQVYLYSLYNNTGLQDQSLQMDFELWNGVIYDRNDGKIIVSQRGASNNTCLIEYFTYNGTHVQGENSHAVIIPEELDEETWDWILFTMLIVSISAIGAATAFNGFNQTAFLCFLNMNIFIGCWYDIYPIELIVLPMAILAVVIFRTAGDVTE